MDNAANNNTFISALEDSLKDRKISFDGSMQHIQYALYF